MYIHVCVYIYIYIYIHITFIYLAVWGSSWGWGFQFHWLIYTRSPRSGLGFGVSVCLDHRGRVGNPLRLCMFFRVGVALPIDACMHAKRLTDWLAGCHFRLAEIAEFLQYFLIFIYCYNTQLVKHILYRIDEWLTGWLADRQTDLQAKRGNSRPERRSSNIRHRLNGYLAQRYLVFFLQAVLGCVWFVKFLKVCFPGGLGTH